MTPGLDRRAFLKLLGGGIIVLVRLRPSGVWAQGRGYPTDINAYLRIGENGRVTVFSGKIEMGQGVMTSLAQMAAEDLGVSLDSIEMILGDTDRCPWDMGTFGSLTTRMFGPALRTAAAEARQVLMELAAKQLGAPGDRLEDLRDEARARLARIQEPPPAGLVPRYVVQMQPEQRHALVVDTARSTLYVFENRSGEARYVTDYYISIGKNGIDKFREGDNKTPLGVYHVTGRLSREKLNSTYGKLAEQYGVGALPISYPNEWDRREGRNGFGIWLHGVPFDTYSRPPRASDGCLALANPDLESVGRHVQVGMTPVIIADKVEWASSAALEAERAALAGAVEQWRADWQSRDTGRYLTHYSQRFASGKQDYAAWSAHKHAVNAAKTWIKVRLSRLAMFRYPRESDFVVVTFDQDYRSNGLTHVMKKRQYWIKEGGAWKILYEGAA